MSATDTKSPRKTGNRLLLEFLGSMNLAITLLVTVGIASIIGTVLKQNEAYQNYIIKFGPFWFEVFNAIGLYDVYSAAWFLLILAFLVLSTSTCIYRNAPKMLHDMRSYRLDVNFNSLNAFHSRRQWHVQAPAEVLVAAISPVLTGLGYRVRSRDHGDHIVVSAKKGAINRLGYLFTHSAIVIICIGGLVDGNLLLKWRAFSGDIVIETRDISASRVPDESRLSVSNPSFRGSVNIPEGSSVNLAFINLRDGYLVQPLPFSVEVQDFRIEHYSTGQPKSFESDLLIHDIERDEPLAATIAVNHPLIYRGYSIYQASFSDGGSELALRVWPLLSDNAQPVDINSAVFEELDIDTSEAGLRLELTNFRLFNINPVQDEGEEKAVRNFGPNFSFKLRNARGEAVEYENYMLPVDIDGRQYYLSGMRETPNEPFRYLYIPVGPDGGIERFMQFNAMMRDPLRTRRVAVTTAKQSVSIAQIEEPGFMEQVTDSMHELLVLFAARGFNGVEQQVEATVPDAERENVLDAYLKVLQTMLAGIYAELLEENNVDLSQGISEQDSNYFDDAVNAIGAIANYGAPVYIQLKTFEHIQSTGLQITRAPGKTLVYFGFALLIAGVFCMFYIAARRIWLWVDNDAGQTRLLLAGSGLRHQRDFEAEFARLQVIVDDQIRKI